MTYTGDVLIKYDQFTGDLDIEYQNGQPMMTDSFESCVILAVFGRQNVQNGMIDDPDEQYISTFPEVINRANVSDETRENGVKAIEKALAFMVNKKMAERVTVVGEIINAYTIIWSIDIYSPNGTGGKYELNWQKGSLTFGYKGALR